MDVEEDDSPHQKSQPAHKPQKTTRKAPVLILCSKPHSSLELTFTTSPEEYTKERSFLLGNYPTITKQPYNDKRLRQIDSRYFLNKKVLDLGCNNGVFTLEVAMRCFPQKIVGVDIDSRLIREAKKKKELLIERNEEYRKFEGRHATTIDALPLCFKQKLESKYGVKELYLPEGVMVDVEGIKALSEFPKNVQFRAANMLCGEISQQYDCVLCLRVTRWMHMALGDDAIRELFERLSQLTRKGGHLIIEYQPWSSYKNRKNMNDLYRRHFAEITIDPSQFPTLLAEVGFEFVEQVGEQGKIRPILVFRRTD